MQIITLTTDWGEKDQFIGQVKGLLYSTIADVNVVDITHNIKKYDIFSASFIVKNACMNFPENTIHIIDVDSYEDKDKSFIVVKANKQYYICVDNGLPSLVFADMEKEITTNTLYSESNFYTFAVLDNFCKVAKRLSENRDLEGIGYKMDDFVCKRLLPKPAIEKDRIICTVVYVDDYGNAYLNINNDTFLEVLDGRGFEIEVDRKVKIKNISHSYQDAKKQGDALLSVSATKNLQLSLREDNLSRLLRYNINDQVIIKIV